MSTIKKFEDIIAWQKARELAKLVYQITKLLSIAKGSCKEVKSQLYRAIDQKYIEEDQFSSIYNFTDEIASAIGKLISYLAKTEIKGSKYLN